jgi:hypothetical protein
VSAFAKSAKVCEGFYVVCTSMYWVSLSKVCEGFCQGRTGTLPCRYIIKVVGSGLTHIKVLWLTLNADLVEIPPPSALPRQEHVDANDVPQDTYKHVATLSNEQFFHHRVLPLLQSIESDVPRYRLRLTVLKILMMISATIATVLGAVQKPVWIPIAVSASTVFVSTLEHFKYKTRLAGATVAAAELRALVSDWEALGAVARRMGDTRKRLVRTSEGVAISLASTWTGGSFMEAVTQVPDASQDEERSP